MSSDYKKYLVRQMGLTESTFPPKSPEESEDPAKDMETQSSNLQNLSPTAKGIPIIGLAVRGAPSGGLPSGRELAPSKLGGYTKVQLEKPNSDVIDKTPKTGIIDNPEPIAPEGSIPPTPSDPHAHQIQKKGEQPDQPEIQTTVTNPNTAQGIEVQVTESKNDDDEHNDNDPEYQSANLKQFCKDRSASDAGDEVRKYLNINEWKADKIKRGALHKDLGISPGQKIPTEKLQSLAKALHTKAQNGKLPDRESLLSKRVNAALNARKAQ